MSLLHITLPRFLAQFDANLLWEFSIDIWNRFDVRIFAKN